MTLAIKTDYEFQYDLDGKPHVIDKITTITFDCIEYASIWKELHTNSLLPTSVISISRSDTVTMKGESMI